ncbi:MAG TPA: hypothetical protein VMT18_05445 [Planctomycetota bacterium]|nr:hypothetical protein [Planctomycetota bacterium]
MHAALVGLALALPLPRVDPQGGATWRHPGQVEVDRAIERGTAFLRAGWAAEHSDRLRRGQARGISRSGERALVGYTLLKAGIEREDPAVRQIVAELAFEEIEHTYDVACTLLLLEEHDARAHRGWIAELAGRLLAWQNEYGWGYPSGHDLSNTQYGALGLWAAARAGVEVPPEAWRELSSAVTHYGTKRGGFAYVSGVDGGASGSMTAAGVGTLALCEMELARAGALDSRAAWVLHGTRARALEWLRGEYSVTTNPRGGAWTYYWLYGLERMAAFSGLTRIGEQDWYGDGAGWLIATQGDHGAWQGRVETCFAVLFLARAALGALAPPSGPDSEERCRTEPEAALRFEARPFGERTAFRLLGLRRPVAEALEWPGEARRGPRVLRVEYLADGEVVAVGVGNATEPMLGHTFPASARLANGPRELHARVHALVPPGRPGAERGTRDDPALALLESPTLRCTVESGGLLLAPVAAAENMLAREGVRVEVAASSTHSGFDDLPGIAFGPERAIDGRVRRPWLAGEHDARAALRISLRKPVRANTLRIRAARLSGYPDDELARPLELSVRVNDELELRVPMPPDPARAARVDLGEPLAVRELEVRILSRVSGRRGDVVGLGEIELALASE